MHWFNFKVTVDTNASFARFKIFSVLSHIKISLHSIPGNNSDISEHDNDVVTFKCLVCVCTHTHVSTQSSQDGFEKAVPAFHVNSGDQAQVARLAQQALFLLDHLTAPAVTFKQRNISQVFPYCFLLTPF